MLIKLSFSAVLAALAFACFSQPSYAVTCGSWAETEKSIRWWWGKAYPKEKILSIDQNGPARTYSKVQSTNQKKIDEYGNEWEYYKQNPYCSVPAKLKVQQESGPRIFSVSAIFKVSGKKFSFDDVATGGSEAVLEPGQAAAPDKDEIKKVITETFLSYIPPKLKSNIQVDKVLIAPRELQRWGDGQTAYSMSNIDLFLIIDGVHKDKCNIQMVNLYKGDVKNKRLNADGPWKIQFVLLPSVAGCTEKYQSPVYDYIVNPVPAIPPPKEDTTWIKEVAGTYTGDIEYNKVNQGTTVLTMTDRGTIDGTFAFKEGLFESDGSISNCKPVKENELKCSWKNQQGRGYLTFNFDKDRSSFTGRWWSGSEKDATKWDGRKTSGGSAAPGLGQSSTPAADKTPVPNINKTLKGFGF